MEEYFEKFDNMTTPRSPVNRKVADTSFEEMDGAAKAQKLEEPPAWARTLLASMQKVEQGQERTEAKLDRMEKRMEELEGKVASGEMVQANLEDKVSRLELENATLRGELAGVRADLDKQIDSDLREHLVLYGVPGSEKTWEETARRLAKWFGENIDGRTEKEFDQNIWRAHRGPYNPEKGGPRPIFVYMNYRYIDLVQQKMKSGPIGGVSIKEQYSSNTQARVNEALAYRKVWKARNANSKAFIAYPAVLKVQKEGESGYRVEKSF